LTIDINLVAKQFTEELDRWYSQPEQFDNELDRQIHTWYSNPPQVWPKRPYFSPSNSKACPRELYVKAKRAKKDAFPKPPYQGRWQEIGTAIGDVVQRTVLAMERNLPDGRFRFERNGDGTPMFEDFAKRNTKVERNGQTFYLYGTTDGIMEYVNSETGEIIRIGLEVKSKQSTPAKTSLYSFREAEEGHRKQCVAYSVMYDVDYFIILYVNAAKKSWVMSDADYEATPDIRAFGIEITDDDRAELLDYFADITKAINEDTPPALDLQRWTFNNFKTACALSLTDEEFGEIKAQAKRIMRSGLPDYKKQGVYDAIEFIREVREGEAV
jgi:CRISPR/Cas system-associated exonuclease Cas4 (RecB family)